MVDSKDTVKELKAVKRQSLHELIVGQIHRLIEQGKLKTGDRLPPERELAEAFKVSRHTVREAIRTLEEQNILNSKVGSGTYVVMEEEKVFSEVLAGYILQERDKIAEVFQFRRMVEPQIAAWAASNASDEDLASLREIVAAQSEQASDENTAVWADLDQQFHLAIARATGNSVLTRVVELFLGLLEVCREDVYRSPERLKHSVKGHTAIVEAISAHSPKDAMRAMTKHIEFIEKLIEDGMGD